MVNFLLQMGRLMEFTESSYHLQFTFYDLDIQVVEDIRAGYIYFRKHVSAKHLKFWVEIMQYLIFPCTREFNILLVPQP